MKSSDHRTRGAIKRLNAQRDRKANIRVDPRIIARVNRVFSQCTPARLKEKDIGVRWNIPEQISWTEVTLQHDTDNSSRIISVDVSNEVS
jgi:hypothetical protein